MNKLGMASALSAVILTSACAVDVGPAPFHHTNYGPEYDRGYIGGYVGPTVVFPGGRDHERNHGVERHRDHRN